MTKDYTIVKCPGRNDLLLGLTAQRSLFFVAKNEEDGKHLFKVRVGKLGLDEENGRHRGWTLNGQITAIDGQHLKNTKPCDAYFDAVRRTGTFYEHSSVREYSWEYFSQMSNEALRMEIQGLKSGMPKRLSELERYVASLSPREQLVVSAMHASLLYSACSAPMIEHQLNRCVDEIMGRQ